MNLEKVVQLKGRRTFGAEHTVFIDEETGQVQKYLNRLGKIWNGHGHAGAEFDYNSQCRHGIEVTPTENYAESLVRNGGSDYEKVSYLVRQGFVDAPTLRTSQLFFSEDLRRQLLDIFLIGQEIRREDNRGLDIVGGQMVKEFAGVLNPRVEAMNPKISNLKIPESDVISRIDMPQCDVKVGNVIARGGKLTQIDTRMYNFEKTRGIIKAILVRLQDAQDTAISSILKKFGYETGFDCDATRMRRLIRYLFEKAFPKMQAYAEGVA